MGCDLYKVTTGSVDVARHMPLDTALILVKALMVEYYNEPGLEYTIKRERRTDGCFVWHIYYFNIVILWRICAWS